MLLMILSTGMLLGVTAKLKPLDSTEICAAVSSELDRLITVRWLRRVSFWGCCLE